MFTYTKEINNTKMVNDHLDFHLENIQSINTIVFFSFFLPFGRN